MRTLPELRTELIKLLHEGTVIPAHPLALNEARKLDERRQRALTRYYIDSGVGGIAVGVHTTQFEIRNDEHDLLDPVLRIAAETVQERVQDRPFIKVAGICGPTRQAVEEAEMAVSYGYDMGLLSMGGLEHLTEDELIERTKVIARIIPVFGFYLQPAVGGRKLSYGFWRKLADIPEVHAIKIAPFNRYQTLDVVRAVCDSDRCDEIALYTGNDDNLVADLLTPFFRRETDGQSGEKRIVGGLLGQWAVWTRRSVEMLEEIKRVRGNGRDVPVSLLSLNSQMSDANAAIFDAAHDFKGCIPGINEVLRRQGLLEGRWCLNSNEEVSPGQLEEIDRVYGEYPHLNDDEFVRAHLDEWLA